MATRREQNRQLTLTEIKTIAKRIMAEQGTAGLSLRAIATEMGMAVSALYRYYASRDELVTILIIDAYHELGDYIRRQDDQINPADLDVRLMATANAYRDWALAHPTEFQLIFGNPIPGYSAPAERTIPAARYAGAGLSKVIQDAVQAGYLRSPPVLNNPDSALGRALIETHASGYPFGPEVLYWNVAFWGLVHGLVVLELHHHIQPLLGGQTAEFYQEQVKASIRSAGWPIR